MLSLVLEKKACIWYLNNHPNKRWDLFLSTSNNVLCHCHSKKNVLIKWLLMQKQTVRNSKGQICAFIYNSNSSEVQHNMATNLFSCSFVLLVCPLPSDLYCQGVSHWCLPFFAHKFQNLESRTAVHRFPRIHRIPSLKLMEQIYLMNTRSSRQRAMKNKVPISANLALYVKVADQINSPYQQRRTLFFSSHKQYKSHDLHTPFNPQLYAHCIMLLYAFVLSSHRLWERDWYLHCPVPKQTEQTKQNEQARG